MTNDAERVSDIVARLRAERDEAQSLVTAWQSIFEGIEAHLMDRVNMDDEASPKTYLEIIRSDVARVIVTSKQIVAARWADYARQQAIIEAQSKALAEARAEIAETKRILEGCLAVAVKGDPLDAPFPMEPHQAVIWHQARTEAFRHALEMMPSTPTPENPNG